MPVLATIEVPKLKVNAGESKTFGPYAAPGSALAGMRLTIPRSTSGKPDRRDDSQATTLSFKVEGLTAGGWITLAGFTTTGGVWPIRGGTTLQGDKPELEDDVLSSVFPATAVSQVRVQLVVQGDRFAGSSTLELIGP